jgi:TrkA domain protein
MWVLAPMAASAGLGDGGDPRARIDGRHIVIIERVALPGIGTCHTATTARRQRIGVVSHRNGRRDLVIYDPDDPHRAAHAVVLDAAEASHVADLLAAAVTVDHVAALERDLERDVAGIDVARIRVPAGSSYDGRPLRDTGTRFGVSVVAVVRDGRAVAAPSADFVVRHGDTVVVAGASAGIAALTGAVVSGRTDNDPPTFRPDPPSRRLGRRRPQPATGPPR